MMNTPEEIRPSSLTREMVSNNIHQFLTQTIGRAIGTYAPIMREYASETMTLAAEITLGKIEEVDLITLSRMFDYMSDLNQFHFWTETATDAPTAADPEKRLFGQLRLKTMQKLQQVQPDVKNADEYTAFNRLYIQVRSQDRDTYNKSARLKAITRNILNRNLDYYIKEQVPDVSNLSINQRKSILVYIKERISEELDRWGKK